MKKILLIDDDNDNLHIITEVLTMKGFAVVAINQSISVEAVIELKPDLVIVDHYLTGQNGGDFCLKIKQNKQSEYLPVILISTGLNLKEISEAGLADAFLAKPFNIDDLENIAERFAL